MLPFNTAFKTSIKIQKHWSIIEDFTETIWNKDNLVYLFKHKENQILAASESHDRQLCLNYLRKDNIYFFETRFWTLYWSKFSNKMFWHLFTASNVYGLLGLTPDSV